MKKLILSILSALSVVVYAQGAAITNLPAINVTSTSAVIRATVFGLQDATLYWGLTDGGTNSWSHTNNSVDASHGQNPVTNTLTGLTRTNVYYYRWAGRELSTLNPVWSAGTTNLTTLMTPGIPTNFLTATSFPVTVSASGLLLWPLDFMDVNGGGGGGTGTVDTIARATANYASNTVNTVSNQVAGLQSSTNTLLAPIAEPLSLHLNGDNGINAINSENFVNRLDFSNGGAEQTAFLWYETNISFYADATAGSALTPYYDNLHDFGKAGQRWRNGYFGNVYGTMVGYIPWGSATDATARAWASWASNTAAYASNSVGGGTTTDSTARAWATYGSNTATYASNRADSAYTGLAGYIPWGSATDATARAWASWASNTAAYASNSVGGGTTTDSTARAWATYGSNTATYASNKANSAYTAATGSVQTAALAGYLATNDTRAATLGILTQSGSGSNSFAGFLGVGVTTPSVRLEVAEPVANIGAKFSLYNTDTSIELNDLIVGIYAKGRDAGANYPYLGSKIEFNADGAWDTQQAAGYTATRIDLFTQDSTGTDRLLVPRVTIKGTGLVGIGTNAPATTLDVNGPATVRGNLNMTGNDATNISTLGLIAFDAAGTTAVRNAQSAAASLVDRITGTSATNSFATTAQGTKADNAVTNNGCTINGQSIANGAALTISGTGITSAVVKAITTYGTTNPVFTINESTNVWSWNPPTNVPITCTFSGPGAGYAASGMIRLSRTNNDNTVTWPTNVTWFVAGTRTATAPTLAKYNRIVVDYFDNMWTLGLVSTNSTSL